MGSSQVGLEHNQVGLLGQNSEVKQRECEVRMGGDRWGMGMRRSRSRRIRDLGPIGSGYQLMRLLFGFKVRIISVLYICSTYI